MPGPTTPPVGTRFSTGQDLALLDGPTTAPGGAVTINPGTDLPTAISANPNGTTFYLTAGTHVLGGGSPSPFDQLIPKPGNTFIGAPGAILNGRDINRYCTTGSAAGVSMRYLEIVGFNCLQEEFVVNHDTADDFTILGCNIHDNNGAAVGVGSGTSLTYSWLHHNGQYGFSAFHFPTGDASTCAIDGVVVDHCEIAFNGDVDDEIDPVTNAPTYVGRNGACKFWDTRDAAVTNNWIHHSGYVGIWADTNNEIFRLEGNLIEDNNAEGFFYEISYNFLVKDNTFRRNAIFKGLNWASRGDNFPIAAIYISEAGGLSAVSSTYASSSIEGNTFENNWADITLWENADRYTNSPANTSGKIWKAKGATLGMCNRPTAKVLTVSTTAGSPNFTVTSGALESTDEGRAASGSGIPGGAKIVEPSGTVFSGGVSDSTHGVLTANATATASGVTLTLAAGTINTEPAYTTCRWHTQNVHIHDNTFSHDSDAVLDGETLPSGVRTGKIAVLSQTGTYPDWSPYHGTAVQDAVTFEQNNLWEDNTYIGDYSFMPFDTGMNLTFAQWQGPPYNQDAGSTLDGSAPGPGAPTGATAVAGLLQATVTFTAPADDGGSPITSYTVTSSPGGITGSGSASPITVTGLTGGVAYTFTVRATTAAGTGPASSPSNSVTPTGGGPPPDGDNTTTWAQLGATPVEATSIKTRVGGVVVSIVGRHAKPIGPIHPAAGLYPSSTLYPQAAP